MCWEVSLPPGRLNVSPRSVPIKHASSSEVTEQRLHLEQDSHRLATCRSGDSVHIFLQLRAVARLARREFVVCLEIHDCGQLCFVEREVENTFDQRAVLLRPGDRRFTT